MRGRAARPRRRAFGELVVIATSARGWCEIFFATTALKKDNGVDGPSVKARAVQQGRRARRRAHGRRHRLRHRRARRASPVRIKDTDDAGVGRALKHVRGLLDERVRSGARSTGARLDEDARAGHRRPPTTRASSSVDLVIEAVFEDLELKHGILAEVEAATAETCIFASNTCSHPDRPSSPRAPGARATSSGCTTSARCTRCRCSRSSPTRAPTDWVTATCVELGKKQGKTVIVVNDGAGLLHLARSSRPYMNEAAHLLVEGADIAELDQALRGVRLPGRPDHAARRGGHRRRREGGPRSCTRRSASG